MATTYNREEGAWAGRANSDAPKQTYEEFLAELAKHPGLLGKDGTLQGSAIGGGPWDSWGKTPREYYDEKMAEKVQDGFSGFGDDMSENLVDRKFVSLERSEDTRGQGLRMGLGMLTVPFAAGAMGFGGASAAAAPVAATPASGLAGTFGMNAGMGATALNTGALNAGMTLARGGSLTDAIKSGATGALLSPVGTLASNAAAGAGAGKVMSILAGGAAQGGAGAIVNGKPIGQGITNGVLNAGVGLVGNAMGKATTESLSAVPSILSKGAGSLVSSGVKALATGKSLGSAVAGSLANSAFDSVTDKGISGFAPGVKSDDFIEGSFGGGSGNLSDGVLGTGAEIAARQGVDMDENEDALSDSFWSSDKSPTYAADEEPVVDSWGSEGRSAEQRESEPMGFLDSLLGGSGINLGGATKSITDWLGSNKDLARTLLGGISAAQSNSSAIERQMLQNQSQLDQLNLRQQHKLEDNQRYSDSVVGLKPQGLIGGMVAKKLTRTDGTPVYGSYGMLNRG